MTPTAIATQKATFGAGCFWHVESDFRKLAGVVGTQVGYAGGSLPNPTYEDVCSDTTGHAEVVEVEYDPSRIAFEKLLDVFWSIHNPTTRNRQGPDVGTQYRSVIFFHTPEQQTVAGESKRRLQARLPAREVVTQILPAPAFWRAEEHHQRYYEKHGTASCRV